MLIKTKAPAPTEGEKKITRHFALFPSSTDDGIIWLEKFERVYEWRYRLRLLYGLGFSMICGGWDLISTRRIEKSR